MPPALSMRSAASWVPTSAVLPPAAAAPVSGCNTPIFQKYCNGGDTLAPIPTTVILYPGYDASATWGSPISGSLDAGLVRGMFARGAEDLGEALQALPADGLCPVAGKAPAAQVEARDLFRCDLAYAEIEGEVGEGQADE